MLRVPVKWAAAAVVAGLTLSACGSARMGAAAIAGDQRISASTLTAQAENLRAAYQKDQKKVRLTYPVSQIPQQVLSWLLRFQIRDAMARRSGIRVTPAQQQQALAQLSAQVKGSGFASLAEAGVASGIPPDLLGELANYQEIAFLLVKRLDGGKQPTTPAAQNALDAALVREQCLASKSLSIKVNPQFGAFDYAQLAVVPARPVLSATQPGGAPSPGASPSPRLTPPC